MKPNCFETDADWQAWLELRSVAWSERAVHYCADCTYQHQQRMKRLDRCAHPGVSFVETDDGIAPVNLPRAALTAELLKRD